MAQLDARLPRNERWAYEPKLDGFRGQLWRSGNALSRNGRDLAPWFPELVAAAEVLSVGTLLDDETVIAEDKGLAEFGAFSSA